MTEQQVPIQDWFSRSFDLYKSSAKLLIPAGLLGLVTIFVPAFVLMKILPGEFLDAVVRLVGQGLLSGPIFAGLFLLALRVHDGRSDGARVTDVFRGFDYLVPTFSFAFGLILVSTVLNLVLGIVPFLGVLLAVLISIAISVAVAFTIPILVDQKKAVPDAIRASVEKVKQNPVGFACFFFLAGLASACGAILFGVGILLTMWFVVCASVVAYRGSFLTAGGSAVPADQAPPPPPPPAPDSDAAAE